MTIERSVGYENVDPKLSWDGKNWEGSENMSLKPKKIWAVASLKNWINSICWQQLEPLNSEMKMEKHSKDMNLKIGLRRLKWMTFMWGLEILQIVKKKKNFLLQFSCNLLHTSFRTLKLKITSASRFKFFYLFAKVLFSFSL